MPELRLFIERDYTANDSHSVDTGASFSLLLTADFDKPGVLFSTMTQEHRGMEAGVRRRKNRFYAWRRQKNQRFLFRQSATCG